jgi:hypothetical protein
VKDKNGFAVAYVYYEEEPGRRSPANLMTKDEARRIAANIAKLPGLVRLLSAPPDSATCPPPNQGIVFTSAPGVII